MREAAKPLLELLSGVPTVVYGYFALLFVTPLLQKIIPGLPGFNLLSAGLVMGIMIIPYVSSVSEDAMRAVPMSMREGSYAMGATRFQTAVRVVVPARAVRHRRGLHPRHLARGRRDHDRGGRRRHAAEPDLEPDWSRRRRSPRSSCRWRSATCRTAASATRPSSPPA